MLLTSCVLVPGAHRDKRRALVLPAMELIDHERFKAISNRVKPVHPSGPASHVGYVNGKTSVHDQAKDEESSRGESLGKGSTEGGDRSEEHGHDHRKRETDEHEEEICSCLIVSVNVAATKALLTRFTSEIGHEVQSQVENDTVHNLVRNVGKSRGDRFG